MITAPPRRPALPADGAAHGAMVVAIDRVFPAAVAALDRRTRGIAGNRESRVIRIPPNHEGQPTYPSAALHWFGCHTGDLRTRASWRLPDHPSGGLSVLRAAALATNQQTSVGSASGEGSGSTSPHWPPKRSVP